jgi:hypothetical protein
MNTALVADVQGAPDVNADPLVVGSAFGRSLYFTGDIGEIILYRRALTAPERASVQGYLDDKWQL